MCRLQHRILFLERMSKVKLEAAQPWLWAYKKAKATLACLKEYLTKARKTFEKDILMHVVSKMDKSRRIVDEKLEKVHGHLMVMEEIQDINMDFIQKEYDTIDAMQNQIRKDINENMKWVSETNNGGIVP